MSHRLGRVDSGMSHLFFIYHENIVADCTEEGESYFTNNIPLYMGQKLTISSDYWALYVSAQLMCGFKLISAAVRFRSSLFWSSIFLTKGYRSHIGSITR